MSGMVKTQAIINHLDDNRDYRDLAISNGFRGIILNAFIGHFLPIYAASAVSALVGNTKQTIALGSISSISNPFKKQDIIQAQKFVKRPDAIHSKLSLAVFVSAISATFVGIYMGAQAALSYAKLAAVANPVAIAVNGFVQSILTFANFLDATVRLARAIKKSDPVKLLEDRATKLQYLKTKIAKDNHDSFTLIKRDDAFMTKLNNERLQTLNNIKKLVASMNIAYLSLDNDNDDRIKEIIEKSTAAFEESHPKKVARINTLRKRLELIDERLSNKGYLLSEKTALQNDYLRMEKQVSALEAFQSKQTEKPLYPLGQYLVNKQKSKVAKYAKDSITWAAATAGAVCFGMIGVSLLHGNLPAAALFGFVGTLIFAGALVSLAVDMEKGRGFNVAGFKSPARKRYEAGIQHYAKENLGSDESIKEISTQIEQINRDILRKDRQIKRDGGYKWFGRNSMPKMKQLKSDLKELKNKEAKLSGELQQKVEHHIVRKHLKLEGANVEQYVSKADVARIVSIYFKENSAPIKKSAPPKSDKATLFKNADRSRQDSGPDLTGSPS